MISPEIFYLHIQGEQRGPYTIPQIDHLLNSGLIAVETLYWCEGLDQWAPVTNLVRLRRKANPWSRRLVILSVVLLLAAGVGVGSIALVGWRETNQHDYTEEAAYWRARDAVRGGALSPNALVQFREFSGAHVELQPPRSATVTLPGVVTLRAGENRPFTWRVPLTFDYHARQWSAGPIGEAAP